jgi:hypothetical protein
MQGGILTEIFVLFFTGVMLFSSAANACLTGSVRTSPDRSWSVFESASSDCVPGAKGEQVYARKTSSGKTTVVSSSLAGIPGDAFSHFPVISADHLFVFFQSNSTNLVPGGDNLYRIYRKNLGTGKVDLLSTGATGKLADGASFRADLSGNGRFLFFESVATNLVPGVHGYQIYRKDIESGALLLVSVDSKGVPGDGSSGHPSSSEDGLRVAFMSNAKNLVPGVTGNQIYAKDLATGKVEVLSLDAKGIPANGYSTSPVMSADGSSVTFSTAATNWAAFPNPQATFREYRKDRKTGGLTRTKSALPERR